MSASLDDWHCHWVLSRSKRIVQCAQARASSRSRCGAALARSCCFGGMKPLLAAQIVLATLVTLPVALAAWPPPVALARTVLTGKRRLTAPGVLWV